MIRINNRKSKNKQRNKQTRAHRKHRKHSKHNKDNKHNKNNMVQIGGGNSSFLQVQYPGIAKLDSLNVDYTEHYKYKPNQQGILAKEPSIEFNSQNTSNASDILLVMHDPDAPSKTSDTGKQEWIHWIAVFDSSGNKKKDHEYVRYMGPSPPRGSGVHNYIFDIYDLEKIKTIKPIKPMNLDIISQINEIRNGDNRGGQNAIINALNDNNAGYKIDSVRYTINSDGII